MIYTPVSEPTQPTETNPITLPLHNWEALHQLEKEQDLLVLQGTVSSAVAAGTGVFGNPLGFFIFALAYRPLISAHLRFFKLIPNPDVGRVSSEFP